MIYAVTAKLAPDRCREFHLKLTDGTISNLRPDGSEIVASMARARIDNSGSVRWTETCYCRTPLAHERETVLDCYFSDIETELVDRHSNFDGEHLMDRLDALSNS